MARGLRMRLFAAVRHLRILDPALALVIILSLAAAKPLLAGSGLPYGHDTKHHLFRMASMQRSWTHGEYFPSWAEDTYWGYGSPLFHYYSSLTYHITSALQLGFNLNEIQSLRWLLLLSFLMAGAGMYLFCRRRCGRLGALLGGLIYVNSPYLFHVNVHQRGAFPENLALSLFPILLWRLDDLRDAPNARNFILVLLLEVALINTHNLSAVALTAFAFAWLAFEGLIQRLNREAGQLDGKGEQWAALALITGILVAAAFWLPVLLETESVSLETRFWDIDKKYWRSPSELLKIPEQFYGSDLPEFADTLHIGIAQWTYALVGLCGALALYVRGYRTRHPQTFLAAVFFFGLSAPLIFMLTPKSMSLWDQAPIVRYLQFPWRLLGPLAVCLAYLASLNGFLLSRLSGKLRFAAITLAIATPVISGLQISGMLVWNYAGPNLSAAALMTTSATGATYGREFFPKTASRDVDRQRLLDDYTDGYPIDKFDHSRLPAGARATLLQNAPESHNWRSSAPAPFEAIILNYWWPGWTAAVNGSAVPVLPSPGLGLISVSLPAGAYTLNVYLGSTPPRDVGALISGLGLVGGLALAGRLRRLAIRPRPYAVAPPLTRKATIGVLLGALLAVLILIITWF